MTGSEHQNTHDDVWPPRLSDYLDGGQTPAERATLEAHVASCTACAALLDDYRKVSTWLATDQPSHPLPSVLNAVLGKVDTRLAARLVQPRSRRFLEIVTLAAAAILLVVLLQPAPTLPPPTGAGITTSPSSVAALPASPPAGARAKQSAPPDSYPGEVARLDGDVAAAASRLGSRGMNDLRRSLSAIDGALKEAEAARRVEPTNQALTEYVADVQRHRLATMRAATASLENGQ